MIQLQKKSLLLILVVLIFSSCASKNDIIYFNDLDIKQQDKTIFSEPKIQVNDILSVTVSSNSPDLALMYNIGQSASSTAAIGYLVAMDGTITLPILGKIKVLEITTLELEKLLVKRLIDGNQLVNPTVTVRLTNAKFTILGEVNKPGTYTFNEQNITILQALGYAGDLTIHGKRQDILIIREENNKRSYMTIDMTSKKWFESSYYYIKPNDVIYVNPNYAKIKSSGSIATVANLFGVISIALTTILLITKIK
jgi:polysaccharide export outer membrane protein